MGRQISGQNAAKWKTSVYGDLYRASDLGFQFIVLFFGDLYGFTGIYTAPGTLHRGYKNSVAQTGSFDGTLNIFSFCDSFFIFKLSMYFSDLDEIEAGSLDETGRIFLKHGNLFFSFPSQNDEQR